MPQSCLASDGFAVHIPEGRRDGYVHGGTGSARSAGAGEGTGGGGRERTLTWPDSRWRAARSAGLQPAMEPGHLRPARGRE